MFSLNIPLIVVLYLLGNCIALYQPHVFDVADAAIRGMRNDMQSQAVVINGEAGAGKSESAKIVR